MLGLRPEGVLGRESESYAMQRQQNNQLGDLNSGG